MKSGTGFSLCEPKQRLLRGFSAPSQAGTMKIDVFNHILPKRFFDKFQEIAPGLKDMCKRIRNIPTAIDLDARFRMMDEFGEYCQVISLVSPPLESFAG